MANEQMNRAQVLEWLANTGEDAETLMERHCPGMAKRLARIDAQIARALARVRKSFPEACFYTGDSDGFQLLLGCSHDEQTEKARPELSAFYGAQAKIGGGAW